MAAGDNFQDNRSFPKSGATAGVESGLSSVESLKRGGVDVQQSTKGESARRDSKDESAGKFTFRT